MTTQSNAPPGFVLVPDPAIQDAADNAEILDCTRRLFAALCRQAFGAASSVAPASAGPIAPTPLSAILATVSTMRETVSTILNEVRTMSTTTTAQGQKALDLLASLQAELAAANTRVSVHDQASVNAEAIANAEVARLRQLPADTAATEQVLTSIISGLTQARAQAAAIEAAPPATGADTTSGGGAGATTTGGAAAGSTVTGGASGAASTGGAAAGSTVTGGGTTAVSQGTAQPDPAP